MGLLSSFGKGIAKVLDVTTVALAHPIQTATAVVSKKSTVQDVITKHFSQSLPTQITQTILGTAGIAATVAGGAAIGTAAKAGTLKAAVTTAAKSLIPSTVKGKVVAAVAAPVVVGAVVKEPVATAKAVAKVPGELSKFGADVAIFATNPSLETAKDIIKESPVISAGIAAAILGTAVLKVAPAIATARQTEAIQEQTEAIKGAVPVVMPSTPSTSGVAVTEIKPAQPETISQTKTISKEVSKKPRKASRTQKKPFGNINQRVNVIVSNRSSSVGITNKRYIKERILV